MSWTRLDDTWTDNTVLADLSFEDRWHYLAMIQFCSRTQKFDGIVRAVDARRCSDHPAPEAAHANLINIGLLVSLGNAFKLTQIDDHIPPPSVRENSEKSKVRMKRMRQHRLGDHSTCLPDNCPEAGVVAAEVSPPVTGDVTRNTGTGQDRTGQVPRTSQPKQNQPPTHPPTGPSSRPVRSFPDCATPGCDGKLNQALMDTGSDCCADCVWLGKSRQAS